MNSAADSSIKMVGISTSLLLTAGVTFIGKKLVMALEADPLEVPKAGFHRIFWQCTDYIPVAALVLSLVVFVIAIMMALWGLIQERKANIYLKYFHLLEDSGIEAEEARRQTFEIAQEIESDVFRNIANFIRG